MAEETVVTNIVANANFSSLISDLNRVSTSLANLQTQVSATNKTLAAQISVVNRKFGDTLRSTGQFTTHFATVGSDVEKFGKSLDKGQLKLKDYYRTWQAHSKTTNGLIRDLAQQQVKLQNAIMQPLGRNAEGMMQFAVHVPKGLDLIKNKTALAHQELMIMNRVMQEGANQLINWGKNTQWAGRQLTVGLTLPLAAFGKAAADAFKTADQELTRLTKVYGDIAGASTKELGIVRKEVTDTAKELSGSLGASFTETLALGADIAATGKTGQELLGSIRETTRLAVLGEVDRQEAMKATLAIQSAFNQNTTELAESINFLNAVENQTSTTLNDLVEAIPKAGPVIKGLGGSVQDLALYLTAMREGGINASEGANALKSALGALINPTDIAVEKFKGFGIDLLGIVNDNAGNVTNTLLALQSALDTLNPLQKQQAIEQLFGRFQFSRLNALFDNLGRQGSQTLKVLDLMKASSTDLANIAGRELSMVTESASGKYRRAIEELKADLASVGEQFLKINTYVIKFIDKIIDFAGNLPGPIKSILSLLGGITAIAGPLIMLTGVLGNFFGYIVKGVYHFKSLFKGAEGWRLLTPEILAANRAGSMAESTFYSDAKAATILNQALQDLVAQYDSLAARAASGAISVNPIISTLGGNIVSTGAGPRVVDPNHPLVGDIDTRASAHMVPRGVKQPGTIFGLVPSSTPVNLAVRDNPQLYMQESLPPVPGLTTVQTKKYGQISTGIVASEAARHHAMTATLAMQSTEELVRLRKMMKDTGTVTTEFMQTFDDLVPITSQITQNAAAQSAAIVAELRAGKLSLSQAREKIIALNIEIENMLGQATGAYAQSTGRTINLTNVPTLNQPVVGPTGKSNMRELFKQRTGGFFSNIARVLGVRTYGAGYNIETTRPRKFNMGGNVYFNNGDQVPGPNINSDVVPAMLTPGEFVIRRGIAQQDPEGMRMLNAGRAMIVPTFNMGGMIPGIQYRLGGGNISRILSALSTWVPNAVRGARRVYGSAESNSPRTFDPGISYGPEPYQSLYRKSGAGWKAHGGLLKYGERKANEVLGHVITSKFLRQFGSARRQGSSVVLSGSQIEQRYGMMPGGGAASKEYQMLPDNLITITKDFNSALVSRTATGAMWLASSRQPQHMVSLISHLLNAGVPYNVAYRVAGRTLTRINKAMQNLGNRPLTETKWGNIVDDAMSREIKQLQSSYQKASMHSFNRGGMVPGYINGGAIAGISRAGLLAKLGAKFKYEGKMYDGPEALQTYRIKAMDINGGKKYFGHIEGISDKTRGALYDATLRYFNTSMMRGDVINGKRMFTPAFFQTAFPAIAQFALTSGKSWMPPADIAYLESISKKSGDLRGSVGSSIIGLAKVRNKIFGANKGGMVPGYMRGGKIPGIQYKNVGGTVLRLLSMLGIPMAGQEIGSRIGGPLGGAISTASFMAPMFMGSPFSRKVSPTVGQRLNLSQDAISPMRQSIFARGGMLEGFSEKVGTAATSGTKFTSILGKAALAATRLNVGLTAVSLVVGAGVKKWQEYQESLERSRLSAGLNAESASKLGLKYKSLGSELKASIETFKAWMATNKAVYQGMMQANAPFKMTISEYKNLRKEVKGTMADQIDLINNTKDADLSQLAVQLKTMFVAAGMSAEEASKKIYVAFTMSNKSAQAATSTLGNKSFNDITNASTAATAAVNNFNIIMKKSGDGETQLNALNTVFMAISSSIDETVNNLGKKAAKEGTYFNETEARINAQKEAFSKLAQQSNIAVGKGLREELLQTDPVLASMIAKVDTLATVFQKMSLLRDFGYAGNLLGIDPAGIQVLYDQATSINKAVVEKNRSSVLKEEYNELGKLKARRDDLMKAAKGESAKTQIDRREKIKAIDDEIKKINELADNRKKALREEQDQESYNLQLKKLQLELQNQIASGNLEAAAQTQISIRQMASERQTTLAENAIEAKRQAAIKPLETRKDKFNEQAQSMADKAAIASEGLASLNTQYEKQKSKIEEFNKSMTSVILNTLNNTGKTEEITAGLVGIAKDLGLAKSEIEKLKAGTFGINTGAIVGSNITPIPDPSQYTKALGKDKTKSGDPSYTIAFNTETKKWEWVKKTFDTATSQISVPKGYVTPDQWRAGARTFSTDTTLTKRESFGRTIPGRQYLVGERGMEVFTPDMPGSIGPKYNIPQSNYNFNSAGNNGTMGNISLVQNITAAPGMDEMQLARVVTTMAIKELGKINSQRNSMNGSSVVINSASH